MPWRAIAAATAAVLAAIGLARFAYAPLLPVLIAQGWFAPGTAAYLGAANLLGYLLGALGARPAANRLGLGNTVRLGLVAASVSLAACCVPMPFAWFFAWRLVSGIAGGFVMVLGPSSALAQVPPNRRGLAGGVVFTGVGGGIAASGTLVPLLLHWGLTSAWLGLATVAALLTILSWRAWPSQAAPAEPPAAGKARFGTLATAYGLCATAMVPHMVFLVDLVARGAGQGLAMGAVMFVAYGAGALVGPGLCGRAADRFGGAAAFRGLMALVAAALLCLLLVPDVPVATAIAAVIGGVASPGLTAITLGRVTERAATAADRQRGWTATTVAWALGQAAGSYGMAWLLARFGGYGPVVSLALVALVLAGLLETQVRPSAALTDGAARSSP